MPNNENPENTGISPELSRRYDELMADHDRRRTLVEENRDQHGPWSD